MMIKEAMSVFWQTLKDIWEELYSLAIANLVWLLASMTIILFPVAAAGMYYATNRVAHGKTVHFSDFIEGIKKFWWRSLIWFLANILFVILIYTNITFYTANFQGWWVALVGGFWLALATFWLAMQMYFWPMLIEQKETKMLMAWRNSAFLVLASPFFAFFMACFHLLLIVISFALGLPLIFVCMAGLGLLANNAVLTLLVKFGLIKEARPKPLV